MCPSANMPSTNSFYSFRHTFHVLGTYTGMGQIEVETAGVIRFLWFKALAHYKDFHKDCSEKIVVKIVVHI